MIRIVASMLTADFSSLGDEVGGLEAAGVDGIHWDLMDGSAVPALSFGPDVVASCREKVELPFEAHVMIRDPGHLLEGIRDAGCDTVILHPDLLSHPWRTAERVRELGMHCGMALSPATPVAAVEWLLPVIDRVLVMTVEPGFGGQPYLEAMEEKVAAVARLLGDWDGRWEIEVDGGIAPSTIAGSFSAGASVFVVGSALWRASTFAEAVAACRSACQVSEAPAWSRATALWSRTR